MVALSLNAPVGLASSRVTMRKSTRTVARAAVAPVAIAGAKVQVGGARKQMSGVAISRGPSLQTAAPRRSLKWCVAQLRIADVVHPE